MLKKSFLIPLLFLSSCLTIEHDDELRSKGIVAGFYEQKNSAGKVSKYITVQDTSGKKLQMSNSVCPDCLLNDSIKYRYHDESLTNDESSMVIDSCERIIHKKQIRQAVFKTTYIYEREGKQKRFFPTQVPDSSWTFVMQIDTVIIIQ